VYSTIPFWPFVLGVVIVATPGALLDEKSGRAYAFLILLMFAVFHWKGLSAASAFAQRELRRKA